MSTVIHPAAQFEVEQFIIYPGAARVLHAIDVFVALARHVIGDWGDLDEQEWKRNDERMKSGGQLLSSYQDRRGTRFLIITEADRSATNVLLPTES